MKQIIECVPNFSEGQNINIINLISNAIQSVEGVKLWFTDIGKGANRTVFTFTGEPQKVVEAAFLATKTAAQNIDMTKHKGAHPRIGATDVMPLIPVFGITMEKTKEYADILAKKIGNELNIPVYCYAESAKIPERTNLEYCRKGEFEGLANKLKLQEWKPDYGPSILKNNAGASVVGARKFLIAYNINLKTQNVEIAKKIASKLRYSGYLQNGIRHHGLMKGVKAIGWYMPEYSCCQVSTNITDIDLVSIADVYKNTAKIAKEFDTEINGSELIGLIPQDYLRKTGQSFIKEKQNFIDGTLLENIAIENLGLNSVRPFDSQKQILRW